MIKKINDVTFELWDKVADKSAFATFFHTSTWAKIIVQLYPQFSIGTKGFLLDDGEVAVVPLVVSSEKNKIFRWVESLYLGTYGGVIAGRKLSSSEVNDIYAQITNFRDVHVHLIGNPFEQLELPAAYIPNPHYTHVLKLVDFDTCFNNFADDKRRGIKKAKSLGIQVYTASSEKDYQLYYQVYEDSLRRWGDSTLICYPYELFEQLYKQGNDSVRLWLAKIDDEVVSGKLVFYHNRIALYWHGATCEEHLRSSPDPLLMSTIIEDACRNGLEYVDFGPSGGIEGVELYKTKFGAEKMGFMNYEWKDNRLYRFYTGLSDVIRGKTSLY